MGEQIKKSFASTKEYFTGMSPKKRGILIFALLGIVFFSIIATLWLNLSGDRMVNLYTGLDSNEAAEIYGVIKEMGVDVRLDAAGSIKVPQNEVERMRIEMSSKGYPQTGLNYDFFMNSGGLTSTEFENRVRLGFQTEKSLVATLTSMKDISNAIVNLNIAQDSTYIWENTEKKSSAGVVLTLRSGVKTLSREQVSSIKNLVASSVPNMSPDDVKVINSATQMELFGLTDEGATESDMELALQRMGLERQMEHMLEEKAMKQLSLIYSPDDIRVSATVELNYDKMLQESMKYVPEANQSGVITEYDESYAMGSDQLAGGVVGEENNTDIPVIVDKDGDGVADVVDHNRRIRYAVSYIKQQVESGAADIANKTMAIIVKDDAAISQQRRDELIEQAARATNIPNANISVINSLYTQNGDKLFPDQSEFEKFLNDPVAMTIAGVVSGLLIIGIIVAIAMVAYNKKKYVYVNEYVTADGNITMIPEGTDVDEETRKMQAAMEEKKRQLKLAAEKRNTEENGITNEIREFTKQHPEITASLIRSWLREED